GDIEDFDDLRKTPYELIKDPDYFASIKDVTVLTHLCADRISKEHHLTELEEDRYHVEPFIEELTGSRDFYREVKNKPVVSLANFVLDMGKLRFDVGKVYRPVKERRIDQKNRDMLGVFILGTIVLLFFVVTGWRIASGNGIVNPTLTKLGYEALKEKEAKEKEISE
ncbi:hypothetical protein ACFL6I_28875, partial [candidate division KSB1 bacterium]